MRLTDKQKVLVAAATFFVLLAGAGFLNYLKIRQRSELRAEIERYQKEEQVAREKRKQIPILMEQRSKLIETINRYAEILPPEEHVQHDAFVRTMDDYRRDTKILIQTAEYVPVKEDPKQKADDQSFVRHRYRFKLLGTVPDFLEFISKIENHTRFLKIDAISLKPFGATGEFTEGDLGDRNDEDLLEKAKNELKEIQLTVSTYTYVKGSQRSQS